MENFEQLKRNISRILDNRQDIPESVAFQIQKMFNNLEEKYKEMRCYNSSIEQYIQGNIKELEVRLERGIGKRRKEAQYEDIQAFLSEVQRDVEQNLDSEEQKGKDVQRQGQISEIGNSRPNNIGITLNLMDQIVEMLKDVQSRQTRILLARGYGDRQVDIINQEVQAFIMSLRSRNEEGIHESFMQDNAKLRRELLQAYEQYVVEREGGRVLKQTPEQSPQANTFKESLSAGISLKEQNANALAFRETAQQKNGVSEAAIRKAAELFK